MAKINKLTAAQERRLEEFREEWRQVGLCCDPADFEAGDEVIRGFYRRLGKPEPMILHFSSPAMCELAANVVFNLLREGGRSQLGSQLDGQLRSQLRSQLDGQLRSQLRSQLDSQLGSQLRSQLRSQLGSQLRSQLGSQLRSQLDSQLDSQIYSQIYSLRSYFLTNRWGSQHWCAWEAFYLFGHEIGVRYEPENIALLLEWARLSKSVGWWAPWDGICFVSDRPREVHFDGEQRLHCEAGLAVKYSDGWGCHAWHGTRVPAQWIEDKGSVSPADILRHENMEQRRAGTEIIGWAKILQSLGARTVNEDADPEIGTLIEVDLPDVGPSRFVRVRCGTGREFAIGVPPDITSALDGQAWIAGIQTKDFTKPEVRS